VIHPGDWIVADADGVVALASATVEDVLERARRRTAAEVDVIARLKRGETTMEIFGLSES
jgi:4-hydroxy-4-methyl-2-oxoglutarate aldolase